MQQYISDFEQRYRRARNKGFPDLPQEYLMFKIIKNAGLSETEVRIVQTDIDYDEKSKLLESAKAGLVKYFGRGVKAGNESNLQKGFALDEKEEEVNVTNDYRNRSGTFQGEMVEVFEEEVVKEDSRIEMREVIQVIMEKEVLDITEVAAKINGMGEIQVIREVMVEEEMVGVGEEMVGIATLETSNMVETLGIKSRNH